MLANLPLLPVFLVSIFRAQVALSKPIDVQTRGTSHDCAVFIQRWYDNSFDVYDYGYAWTPASTGPTNVGWVETGSGLAAGDAATSTIGSNALIMTDVANPAVVDGATDWDDPGKLSFVWGTETWDTYSAGSPCTVIPVGYTGALSGYPTNTTCYFTCDS